MFDAKPSMLTPNIELIFLSESNHKTNNQVENQKVARDNQVPLSTSATFLGPPHPEHQETQQPVWNKDKVL
jgi:hypothetical protein